MEMLVLLLVCSPSFLVILVLDSLIVSEQSKAASP